MDFCDVLFGAPKNFQVFSLFEARQRPALAFTSLLKVQLLVGIQAHLGYRWINWWWLWVFFLDWLLPCLLFHFRFMGVSAQAEIWSQAQAPGLRLMQNWSSLLRDEAIGEPRCIMFRHFCLANSAPSAIGKAWVYSLGSWGLGKNSPRSFVLVGIFKQKCAEKQPAQYLHFLPLR